MEDKVTEHLAKWDQLPTKVWNTHRVVRESLQDDGLVEGIAGEKRGNVARRLNSAAKDHAWEYA